MFCGCIFNNVVYRAMKYYMGELTGYPSIDKPWLKYYSEEAINAHFIDNSVYQDIFEAMEREGFG